MRQFDDIRADVKTAFRDRDEQALLRLAAEFDEDGSTIAAAWANNVRGTHSVWIGNYDAAIAYFESALSLFVQTNHIANDANSVRSNLGTVYARKGEHAQALAWYRQALEAFLAHHDKENAANVYLNLGAVHYQQTEFPAAMENFHHALDLYEQLGERSGIRLTLSNIGSTYTESGDYAQGLSYFLRALALFEEDGLVHRAVDPLTNIGVVQRNIGRHDEAHASLQRALDVARETSDPFAEITILREIGLICVQQGTFLDACTWFERSSALASKVGVGAGEAHSIVLLCSALVKAERYDEAARQLAMHAELIESHNLPRMLALLVRAALVRRNGKPREALALLQDAIEELTRSGIKSTLEEALVEAASIARELADLELYISFTEAQQRVKDEIRGQEATRRLTMLEAEQRIQAERAETERHRALLHATLPASIAERVMRGEVVNDAFERAAVMFMDMVGFTSMSATMAPDAIVGLLGEIFTICDAIVAEHGLMKIKTIGDSYMSVAFEGDVEARAARASIAMSTKLRERFPTLRVRIGIHSGPVSAGVIGTERLQYDVWGDTVNVASRMESSGEAGRIQVSAVFAEEMESRNTDQDADQGSGIMKSALRLVLRGEIEIKGKGSMTTYWLEDH